MAVITIDGTRLEVTDNKNLLDCALDAGIYIPHLCHHPDLPENSSCRMCMVEVDGQITPSCSLMARDNMVIYTKTEAIQKLRSLALDLLLAGHPEDCSTCPKYGNCELQTLIQYMGGASQRMKHRVKGFKMNDSNPLLVHDMNRCVLCGRCVRVCRDLRGVGILDYKKKDMETYVGTVHDKLLKDADCRFCQACAEVCPTGTIRDKFQMAHPERTKEDAVVPCRAACPAHTNVPEYIRLVKEGRYDEATAVIREKVPFPKALGYVCNHACELDCKRGEVNEAILIRSLKRYAAEADTGRCWMGKGKQLADTGKRICVIGAGPAGMTAAYYLRKQGHDVTVKEALPDSGGMLRYGIPEYRLPRHVVSEEFNIIEQSGIHMEYNMKVENIAALKQEYDAVLTAIGTHQGVRLPLEGNDLSGVLLNTEFLRQSSLHKKTGMGRQVIVLGGGNVAFDCARTAVRLGAEEVHLVCLEARAAMTADEEEIIQAGEEGILIHPGQTFEKITGQTHVDGIDLMNVESFSFDADRRAVIKKEPGSEHHIAGDTVIFATGQRVDITSEAGLQLGRGNCIAVKASGLETDIEGIFAAGDAVYGTKSVIQAIASGREAASLIDRYLGGNGDISEKLVPEQIETAYLGISEGFGYEKRAGEQIVSPEDRKANFNQINHGICREDICREAGRCLQCDLRLRIAQPRLWGDYSKEEVKA